jgi:adenylate cyclase
MTADASTKVLTILFTDLVNSTDFMQSVGDVDAQPHFRDHRSLVEETVEANGGQFVKWTGDGVMAVFRSTGGAICCGVSVQQTAQHQRPDGSLGVRVGITVGETVREDGDIFGTSVVIARWLCDLATAGEILVQRPPRFSCRKGVK